MTNSWEGGIRHTMSKATATKPGHQAMLTRQARPGQGYDRTGKGVLYSVEQGNPYCAFYQNPYTNRKFNPRAAETLT